MIDTIHLYIPGKVPADYNYLENEKGKYNSRTGEIYSSYFQHENMYIKFDTHGAIIFGSINKFFKGNNLETLSRTELLTACKMLAEDLKFTPEEATVRRLDIGVNLNMKYPVREYNLQLLSLQRCKINMRNDYESVYFNNQLKTVLFYDKIAEHNKKSKAKKNNNVNLLRYEVQFKKSVNRIFKKKVSLCVLYQDEFLELLCRRAKNQYKMIKKKKVAENEEFSPSSIRELMEILAKNGLQTRGYEYCKMIIKHNKEIDKFVRLRMNQRLDKLRADNSQCMNELIEELDEKVYTTFNEY
ncbi:MAG: hypothetical protein KKA84_16320 [Bacteroidetes bacterium]|nr:hypothetical protein [Bacteroidota bacterium]